MKIARIETIRVAEQPQVIWVQVHTDTGLVGLGETYYAPTVVQAAVHDFFGPLLIGRDPFEIERHWEAMFRLSDHAGFGGGEMRAISALDMALWDIKGKSFGQPIYRLLGGASPDSVAAYTTFGFNVYSKEELVALAQEMVRSGHGPLKYQSVAANRGWDVSVDVERIRAVREAIGDQPRLIIDCNGKFDYIHARELLTRIEPLDITCVDHPEHTRDLRLMAELRKCTSIPLAARAISESPWENRDLIQAGAVDVMHANVLDGGGYTTCLKIAHMAEMFHLPLATGGGWYLQNGQLIAGVSNGWMTEFHLLRERIYEMVYIDPPVAKDGRLPLPDKPGIGLELNQDAVAEFPGPSGPASHKLIDKLARIKSPVVPLCKGGYRGIFFNARYSSRV